MPRLRISDERECNEYGQKISEIPKLPRAEQERRSVGRGTSGGRGNSGYASGNRHTDHYENIGEVEKEKCSQRPKPSIPAMLTLLV